MLDELGKPIETAVAKGMRPSRMLAKYPLRVTDTFVTDIGNLLPAMVSGSVLVRWCWGCKPSARSCCRRLNRRTCSCRGSF